MVSGSLVGVLLMGRSTVTLFTARIFFVARLDRLVRRSRSRGGSSCAQFDARMGRPSLAPGCYFQLLLVGYFEGLDSEQATDPMVERKNSQPRVDRRQSSKAPWLGISDDLRQEHDPILHTLPHRVQL